MKYKFKSMDKYTKLSIIIILIGAIVRLYLASLHHVSGDACWQLSNARFIAKNLRLPLFEQFGRDEPFWAPPFFHIVSAFIYWLFNNLNEGAAEFAAKMISPIFGTLALIFFFLIAKRLFNKKIAFYSLSFLAFVPLHMDYSVFSYIDGTLTFLAILSVYFAVKGNTIGSAILAGFAILAKYNGIFILPVLVCIICINNKDRRNILKETAIILITSIAIGSVWFIRNWLAFGNPVWPFMNSAFHGIETRSFSEAAVGSINLLNIFNTNSIKSVYLGIFGVPDGNISTLNFFQIPYINFLFVVWLFGTIIFSVPFFIGLLSKKIKHKNLLLIWIGSYAILALLYVVNASWSVSRFLLPAFPAVALIWAHGLESIRFAGIKRLLIALIVMVMIGFVFVSFIKISLAAKLWDFYGNDFQWARTNTNKNDIFISESQCIAYNIERQTVSPELDNLEKANYALINHDFKLDKRALFDNELVSEIKDKGLIVYNNSKTKTVIYRIRQEMSS